MAEFRWGSDSSDKQTRPGDGTSSDETHFLRNITPHILDQSSEAREGQGQDSPEERAAHLKAHPFSTMFEVDPGRYDVLKEGEKACSDALNFTEPHVKRLAEGNLSDKEALILLDHIGQTAMVVNDPIARELLRQYEITEPGDDRKNPRFLGSFRDFTPGELPDVVGRVLPLAQQLMDVLREAEGRGNDVAAH